MIKLGDAFMAMPSRSGTKHLSVVLAFRLRARHLPAVIMANATTMRAWADLSCVLRPDDVDAHPLIQHESFVVYQRMIERSEESMLREERVAPVSAALLLRMHRGAFASRHTPPEFVPFLKEAMHRR